MARPTKGAHSIEPPYALRPTRRVTLADRLWRVLIGPPRAPGTRTPPLRPILAGSAAALLLSLIVDIGPWNGVAGGLLNAGAQEAPERAPTSDLSVPSEADRAALRYFAREGEVDRLEAELRRLRALYPEWQPPRDLLDPRRQDTELAEIWDLVGNQQYDEARGAIAERLQRDPTWEVPPRLEAILELAQIRQSLQAASAADDHARVLRIAEANERVLTCDDVASIWAVANAFASTDRPRRAFDAYAYIIETCEDAGERAASLQKAAETLDVGYVTELFELSRASGVPDEELAQAQLDIVRGAVARGGEPGGPAVPTEWLTIMAESARSGERLEDAMLIGYYLYRQDSPAEAAEWFRFALDNGLGSDAAEGYIVALRATGDRDDAFLAREVAYRWREETPELMEAYLDAVATVLTADELGSTSIQDVDQSAVDRFVPVVIEQRDPNGAQALGWYAFNTCQFIIAEEWFISSANWVPTEAAIFGLALTRLRLGDAAGFQEVVDEWGPLYSSVRALATGEDLDPEDPVTGAEDDPTDEVGVDRVICDPDEIDRLRGLMSARDEAAGTSTIGAGSALARPIRVRPQASRPQGAVRPQIPRRSAVLAPRPHSRSRSLVQPAQAADEPPLPVPQQEQDRRVPLPAETLPSAPPLTEGRTELPPREGAGQDRDARRGEAADPSVRATVRRRVRQDAAADLDARVEEIVERPRARRRVAASAAGGSAAQRALSGRRFSRCVSLTDSAIRAGTLSTADATARGFCLLELDRPFEAAQAFQLARVGSRRRTDVAADAVYGASLSAIAADLTAEAAVIATRAPLSRPRRTELQIGILTQRALAANRDGRYVEALHYLNQRAKIAPLQKDLMLLQGFAYRNIGDLRSAERIFKALDAAGSNSETRQALAVVANDRTPRSLR